MPCDTLTESWLAVVPKMFMAYPSSEVEKIMLIITSNKRNLKF